VPQDGHPAFTWGSAGAVSDEWEIATKLIPLPGPVLSLLKLQGNPHRLHRKKFTSSFPVGMRLLLMLSRIVP